MVEQTERKTARQTDGQTDRQTYGRHSFLFDMWIGSK